MVSRRTVLFNSACLTNFKYIMSRTFVWHGMSGLVPLSPSSSSSDDLHELNDDLPVDFQLLPAKLATFTPRTFPDYTQVAEQEYDPRKLQLGLWGEGTSQGSSDDSVFISPCSPIVDLTCYETLGDDEGCKNPEDVDMAFFPIDMEVEQFVDQ